MNSGRSSIRSGLAERALQQAVAALHAGHADQAEWLAAEAVRANPSDARAQHVLGHALLLQGRAEEAIGPLEQAARRIRDPAVETQLAVALRQSGRDEEALARLTRAVKRRPPFPPAYLELGNLLAALGRSDEAIEVLQQAVAIAPRMGEASVQLGFVHAARGQSDQAREWLLRGLAEQPRDPDALFVLAQLTQAKCDFSGAAELYRRVLALAPDDAASRLGLGVCLLELGQTAAAFEHISAAANSSARMFGEALTALAAAGHGRFWLRPSDAARTLKQG